MTKEFFKSAGSIVDSLIQVFKLQHKSEIVDLLEKSEARIEQTDYDNWDGGTFLFTLFLDIPITLFAHIESKIEQFEREILIKLPKILRNTGDSHLEHVVIAPAMLDSNANNKKPTDDSIGHIWQPDSFRLFLSHSSHYKKEISSLKDKLKIYNISAFLAHKDIKPTKKWENEILLALKSAHALAAFLTPDFHKSKWTDQEVGFALGRGLLTISIKLKIYPYGFMGSEQAISGSFDKIGQLAINIVEVLLQHDKTMKNMHEFLTLSFENAGSFIEAKSISQAILKANNFTQEQLSRIQQAYKNNYQVANSYGVLELIDNYLIKQGFNPCGDNAIPF